MQWPWEKVRSFVTGYRAAPHRYAFAATAFVLISLAAALGLTATGVHTPARAPDAIANPAFVPQYTIGTAILFTGNALRSASVELHEQPLRIQLPRQLEQQSQVLQTSIAASLQAVQRIRANALRAKPPAVPTSEWALAELTAAQAQAQAFQRALDSGDMGPTYVVTLSSTAAHLRAASEFLGRLADMYGMPQLPRAANVAGQKGK